MAVRIRQSPALMAAAADHLSQAMVEATVCHLARSGASSCSTGRPPRPTVQTSIAVRPLRCSLSCLVGSGHEHSSHPPPPSTSSVGHAGLLRRQGHQDLPRPPRPPRRRRRRPRLPHRPPPLRQVQPQLRHRDPVRRRRRVPARPARTRPRAARHRRSPDAHAHDGAAAKSNLSLPGHRLAAAIACARDPSAAAAVADAGAPSAAPAASSSRATAAGISVASASSRDRVAPTGISDTAASRRPAAAATGVAVAYAAGCPGGAQPDGVLMPLILDWLGLRAG